MHAPPPRPSGPSASWLSSSRELKASLNLQMQYGGLTTSPAEAAISSITIISWLVPGTTAEPKYCRQAKERDGGACFGGRHTDHAPNGMRARHSSGMVHHVQQKHAAAHSHMQQKRAAAHGGMQQSEPGMGQHPPE